MEISSKLIGIDVQLTELEQKLSKTAKYPGLGLFAGTAKVGLGLLQIISSIVLTILLTPPLAIFSRKNVAWPASHLIHGFVNIFTGLVEAIPILGTVTFLIREKLGDKKAKDRGIQNLFEKPTHTWLGYKNYQIHLLNEYGSTTETADLMNSQPKPSPTFSMPKTELTTSQTKKGFALEQLGPYLKSI